MKTFFISWQMVTGVLLLCCTCFCGKIYCKSAPNQPVENVMKIQVDDSVRQFLGDSISRIIFEADTIKLFSLSVEPPIDSLKNRSTQTDSIPPTNFHGCYIDHDYGVLSNSVTSPLPILLILSDKKNYLPDGLRVQSPFIPNVALSFTKEDAYVDIIFSFTGGQMYIFTENEDRLYAKYIYERLILRFFQYFMHDERITEYLKY